MVIPGVMMRNPREKMLDIGERTAFTVCHAINIAMTVVLPEPVAIFRARRNSSGFASLFAASSCFQMCAYCCRRRATSVSQMTHGMETRWRPQAN